MIVVRPRSIFVGLALSLLLASVVWAQDPTPESDFGTFGFGLESTGSACCVSVRFWVEDERGSEIVLNAYESHLFVTLRGLQALGKLASIVPYTGVGMTLRLGQIVASSPLSLLMSVQGFIALEYPFPYFEAWVANLETSLEWHPSLGFSAALGLGVHVYF